MAGSKEIRNKIKSVQNTRKITKAMEMVAASKMRKAQERMRHARPYGDKIRTIASHLAHANTEYRHPFLVKREGAKTVGLIVVTSDKGLCGGLNTNALRLALNKLKEWQAEGLESQVTAWRDADRLGTFTLYVPATGPIGEAELEEDELDRVVGGLDASCACCCPCCSTT